MKYVAFFVMTLFIVTATAAAPMDDVTFDSSVEPVFIDGELEGCTAVFDVGHPDFEYNKGQLVHLAGSLNYSVSDRAGPIAYLKLGIEPLGDKTYKAPAEVYLIQGTKTNKSDRLMSAAGETPGFRIFTFRASGQTIDALMTVGQTGKLTFGYAMEQGGMLSVATADVRVKSLNLNNPDSSEMDAAAQSKWLNCVLQVTEAAKRRIRR